MAASLEQVIERLKTEGQLVRWKGDNTLKALRLSMEAAGQQLTQQTTLLQSIASQLSESAKDAARQRELAVEPPQTPNIAQNEAQQQTSAAAGPTVGGPKLKGGLALGAGIAAVGAGLAGFITALTLTGSSGFTGEGLPNQVRNIALAMNELGNMDNRAIAIMGGLLAGGVVLSKVSGFGGILKGATGMAAVGLGLGGFMAGIALASEGIDIMGLDASNFANQTRNVVAGMNELGALNPTALTVMTAMLGAGALLGAFPLGGATKSIKAAVGMTAVGLGLGGFMAGVAAAGDLTGFKGDVFATQAANVAEGLNSIGSLTPQTLATLGALIATGGLLGAFPGGVVIAGKAAVGMGALGFGLGSFMTGIAAAGDLTGFQGDAFRAQAVNIAGGLREIGSLPPSVITGLQAMVAAGGLLGVVPGGLMIAGKAAVGMGAIGFGLGSFVAGFAAAGDIAGALGADGSGFRNIIGNIAGALGEAGKVALPSDGFANFRDGLLNLTAGLTTFAAGGFVQSIANAGRALLNFLSGSDSPVNEVVRLGDNADKISAAGDAMLKLSSAFSAFSRLNLSNIARADFKGFAENLGESIPLLRHLAEGGVYSPSWYQGSIDFKKGILDPSLKLDELVTASNRIREVFGAAQFSGTVQPRRTPMGAMSQQMSAQQMSAQMTAINSSLQGGTNIRGGDVVTAPTITYNIKTGDASASLNANLPVGVH